MLSYAPILAFIFTLLLIPFLGAVARPLGLVDFPGGRKRHPSAVPVVGGVAMFAALAISALIVGAPLLPVHSSLAWAAFLLVMVGMVDDLCDLSPRSRFVAQMAAAVLMASWGGVYVTSLGDILGRFPVPLGNWAIPFTIFGVVGIINALNMMDGLDGVAGGVALIAFAWFAVAAWLAGEAVTLAWLGMLIATLLGFLFYNMRHPWRGEAAVFMGDAGSMMLGFILACCAITLTQGSRPALTPIGAVWVLALPLMDTVSVMLRRIFQGRSPFVADTGHVHHILQLAGWGTPGTVMIILGLSLLLGSVGIAGWYCRIPEQWMFWGFMLTFLAYFVAMTYVGKAKR